MANHRRDPHKERYWRRILRDWQRSGLSVRAFCATRQLSEANFYAWRRVLAQRDRQPPSPPATHDDPTPAPATPLPLFLPIRPVLADDAPALELVLPGDALVRIRPGFDPATLQRLLDLLRGRPC